MKSNKTVKTEMVDKKERRFGESGNILPDRLPCGVIMNGYKHDIDGTKIGAWRIGKPLGVGGFGEIYNCCDQENNQSTVKSDPSFAMKVEPHSNGPLFIERNFYVRAVKPKNVEEYCKLKKPQSLGIPLYRGSGSHNFKGDKYRFLVMDRLGKDLEASFLSGKRVFPPATSYYIALKVLDTLEYIHTQGYAHNDIKAQNLLLGPGNKGKTNLYLVDFGLVSRYHRKGVHLQYEPDDRKAHDGTIPYTSRDAHIGAHSRRSDLEMLGYNLVHWISGKLPWMNNLSNYEYVHMQKNGFMEDIEYFLSYCFDDKIYPEVLFNYLRYVVSMEFDTTPDYKKCRNMFQQALEDEKICGGVNIDLTESMKNINRIKYKRQTSVHLNPNLPKTAEKSSQNNRKRRWSEPTKATFKFEVQDVSRRKSPRNSMKKDEKEVAKKENSELLSSHTQPHPYKDSLLVTPIDTWSWERVIGSGNCELSELLLDHDELPSGGISINDMLAKEHREILEKEQKESLENPTPAMKALMERIKEKDRKREKAKEAKKLPLKEKLQMKHTFGKTRMAKSPGGKGMGNSKSWDLTPNPFTPAMEDILRRQSKKRFRRRFRYEKIL